MNQDGGTAEVFFIDTADPATTRTTFLRIAQQSTKYGTWRTTNDGGSWARVDMNEHPHGTAQIYQPDSKGVVYMAGAYSMYGWGVLRSADYGKTWAHVGGTGGEAVVFGTTKNVFAVSSGAVSPTSTLDPSGHLAIRRSVSLGWIRRRRPTAGPYKPVEDDSNGRRNQSHRGILSATARQDFQRAFQTSRQGLCKGVRHGTRTKLARKTLDHHRGDRRHVRLDARGLHG
jgi:hypothetical protein